MERKARSIRQINEEGRRFGDTTEAMHVTLESRFLEKNLIAQGENQRYVVSEHKTTYVYCFEIVFLLHSNRAAIAHRHFIHTLGKHFPHA